MSLKDLKNKKRDLNKFADNLNKKSYPKDDRFWELTVDKQQDGEAEIRFLCGASGEEENPMISFKQYFIDTPKGKFILDAPENAGLKSFPAEVVTDIWAKYKNTNDDYYKELFKKRVANEAYIANILVVKDPANPENEGKVFLFKFGRQIKNILMKEMGIADENTKDDAKKKKSILIEDEEDDNKEPYDIFDLWEGANLVLRAFSKTGKPINRSYEKSKFRKQAPVASSDEEIAKIYEQQYSLLEFTSEDHYKESYDEIKKRYIEMTGDYYDIFPEKAEEGSLRGQALRPKAEKKSIVEELEEDDDDIMDDLHSPDSDDEEELSLEDLIGDDEE